VDQRNGASDRDHSRARRIAVMMNKSRLITRQMALRNHIENLRSVPLDGDRCNGAYDLLSPTVGKRDHWLDFVALAVAGAESFFFAIVCRCPRVPGFKRGSLVAVDGFDPD
jgi:hypothetical protein